LKRAFIFIVDYFCFHGTGRKKEKEQEDQVEQEEQEEQEEI
jgi:hypothetical protein